MSYEITNNYCEKSTLLHTHDNIFFAGVLKNTIFVRAAWIFFLNFFPATPPPPSLHHELSHTATILFFRNQFISVLYFFFI